MDKCTELFFVYISQFDFINYDNVVANHINLLDKLEKLQTRWPEYWAGLILCWALSECLYVKWVRKVDQPHGPNTN